MKISFGLDIPNWESWWHKILAEKPREEPRGSKLLPGRGQIHPFGAKRWEFSFPKLYSQKLASSQLGHCGRCRFGRAMGGLYRAKWFGI